MENGRNKVWLPAIRAGSGADVYTRRLAIALERNGIATEITWFPLHYELFPFLLRRAQPPAGTDIIIANSWTAFSFKRCALPLVAVVHHCAFDPSLRRYKSALQNLYHRLFAEPREVRSLGVADAVVAVSHCVANQLRKRHGLNNVEVIYNWVDTELFTTKLQEECRDKPFQLLFVGKLSRLKGGDLLAALMCSLGANFELLFTADSHDCKKMNLPPNMIPIGRLSEQEMIAAYHSCDALLLPSRAEGFGYAALEAMACGKPVIASNNTALPELVQDGITGILCDTNDLNAFLSACRRLADEPEISSAMGSAGHRRVLQKFSEGSAADSYLKLIRRLVVY